MNDGLGPEERGARIFDESIYQFQTTVVSSSFAHKDYNLQYILNVFVSVQCFELADPGFSLGRRAPTPKVGVLSDIFAEKQLHENEKIWTPRASLAYPLDPPMLQWFKN